MEFQPQPSCCHYESSCTRLRLALTSKVFFIPMANQHGPTSSKQSQAKMLQKPASQLSNQSQQANQPTKQQIRPAYATASRPDDNLQATKPSKDASTKPASQLGQPESTS
jgi:hypothetical protein